MKRSLRNLAAAVPAAALVLVAAPAANAGPGDAQGCTTTYVKTLLQSDSQQYVTYTPPADVAVHGNAVIGDAEYVTGATFAYVDCVV